MTTRARGQVDGAIDAGTVALTALALTSFASNSVLTRLALGSRAIDAATFTTIRLCAGAVTLAVLARVRAGDWTPLRGRSTSGALSLAAYAVPFSFAYLRIGAAVGSLVLFGSVQVTMITAGILRGERPSALAWTGMTTAVGGLLALTVPAATRPDPMGVTLMVTAGCAWGVYSLIGRGAPDPIAANARSFAWSAPIAMLVSLALRGSANASVAGVALAVVAGAVTSALGYAIWYRALPRLAVTQAAVAQLTVPVIAALGAVLLLHERLGIRLVESGAAILLGVGLVLAARTRPVRQARTLR